MKRINAQPLVRGGNGVDLDLNARILVYEITFVGHNR
jgi:hypothetical protein